MKIIKFRVLYFYSAFLRFLAVCFLTISEKLSYIGEAFIYKSDLVIKNVINEIDKLTEFDK